MVKLILFQIFVELIYTVTKIEICHMVPHNLDQDPQYRRQTKRKAENNATKI